MLNLLRAVFVALGLLAAGASFSQNMAQNTAQNMAAAQAAWVEGDFRVAAELAAGLGTADGYALAAESLGTFGYFGATGDEQAALYAEAVDHAEAALGLAPDSVYAHIQLAHAVGRVAELAGVFEALDQGYTQRVLDLLERAVELDPAAAVAHAGIAVWHARALDEGGLLARMMFGASRDDALEHVDLALEHGAGDKLVLHDTAATLLILSERRYGDRARELLLAAQAMPDRDARDTFLQPGIVDMLAVLDD